MQIILSQLEIDRKITRLAHQIIENTFENDTLFIGGISGNGIQLAEKIKQIISEHSNQTIHVFEVKLQLKRA